MGFAVRTGFLDLEPAAGPAGTVGTIGNFDGAHRGHQAIFRRVLQAAREAGAPAIAVTFDPHPLRILRPDRAPRMILTREQKIEIFRDAGFDELVFIPFDRAIAQVEAVEFARRFLAGVLGLRRLFIGVDFRFGRGRTGDCALLREAGAPTGMEVETVPMVESGGERISASRIRDALAAGDVAAAHEMMGRPYEAIGEVVHGAGRGRGQSAPTANLAVENEMLPGSGVYITETRLLDDPAFPPRPGLTNIGVRPTFEDAGFAVENWIPGFSGDLYGRRLRLRFLERVRDERKFDSPEALRAQIALDLAVLRRRFSGGTGSDA